MNINNLGFFNSLQSRHYKTSPKNCSELIEILEDAYKSYPLEKLNKIWLTGCSVMNKIIEERERGDN
jgi:hypothetical protein